MTNCMNRKCCTSNYSTDLTLFTPYIYGVPWITTLTVKRILLANITVWQFALPVYTASIYHLIIRRTSETLVIRVAAIKAILYITRILITFASYNIDFKSYSTVLANLIQTILTILNGRAIINNALSSIIGNFVL